MSSDLERALTTREMSFTEISDVMEDPPVKQLRLKYNHSMFAGTIDGLTEICLRKLMEMYECGEKLVTVNSVPLGEGHTDEDLRERYQLGDQSVPEYLKNKHSQRQHYSYLTHKFRAYSGRSAPYKVTKVKCKTYWFPVGERFYWGKSASVIRGIRSLEDASIETDATIRRKLQQCAKQRGEYRERNRRACGFEPETYIERSIRRFFMSYIGPGRGDVSWDQINLTINDGLYVSHHDFFDHPVTNLYASPAGNVRKVIDTMRWGRTPSNPYLH